MRDPAVPYPLPPLPYPWKGQLSAANSGGETVQSLSSSAHSLTPSGASKEELEHFLPAVILHERIVAKDQ